MITYVNTVLVGKGTPSIVTAATAANAGKYIIMNLDETIKQDYLSVADMLKANEVKIGLITSKTVTDMNGNTVPVIKWSNNIKRADVKNLTIVANPGTDYTPETVVVDFTSMNANTLHTIDDGGFCLTLRLTYKDLPTRYRKWTDSYEYVTCVGDTATEIAAGFAASIAKNAKGKLMVTLNADRIDGHTLMVNDLGSGTYRLVCVSMSSTELYGTKGALVNVTLQANGDVGTGIKSAQITEQVFTDKDRNGVSFKNLMFFIAVKNSSTILKGDVDGDGVITAQDALLVLQLIPTKMSSTADDIIYQIADVNGDGKISAQDASLILQYLTGKVNW